MKTIFMTGGGGAGTIAAARHLKASGRYRVILGDMDKWAAGLRFGDKAYILPAGADNNFIRVAKDIIRKEKVDIFVPLVDEEILKSYKLKHEFEKLIILLPEHAFSKMALDKWLLAKKFKELNLPHPLTYLATDEEHSLNYPFIAKPRNGRGSKHVIEIGSEKQLKAYKILTGLLSEEIVMQEKIEGQEFTVSVVVNYSGDVLAVVPKEIIYKKGITKAAITRQVASIQEIAIEIQRKLHANGPFNMQLILKKDNTPVIFEINPRYSTTIALTIASGVDEIDLLIEHQTYSGLLLPFKENLLMTRFYDQLYWEEK
ncbi:MAG: ATP-grasp domain-containing protein [Candidatus Omnitrophica bacterium]|nr:ATP-grasp domain-containing protein [Candidatus Omnitrophota bacterium]